MLDIKQLSDYDRIVVPKEEDLMKKIKKNSMTLNVTCSLLQQIVIMISGFALPRIILKTFDSDVNGLVASLNQFLSYVSLIEGGLTGVVSANLYKPLVDGNTLLLNKVLKTASQFYKRIALIFSLYAMGIAIIYPIVVKTKFSYSYIFALAFILSINLFVQYFFSITWKTLLIADKKGYVVYLTYSLVAIVNLLITIVIVHFFPDIHLIKLGTSVIYLVQPLIYQIYIKKNYKIEFDNMDIDNSLLEQRWNGFAINIAAFIHNNTDVVILSLFGTLQDVSVYSVFFLVVTGLKNIIIAISQAISPIVGRAYASGDQRKLNDIFEIYEMMILFVSFLFFTVGGVSITPFVSLYTSGVQDANYNQPVFGWTIIVAELIYCIREPYVTLAYSANRFKDFRKIAYIEAIINVVVSIMLVQKYGITGVAIGTLVSMFIRTIYQIYYLKNHILYRKNLELFKLVIIYLMGIIISLYISRKFIPYRVSTILTWTIYTAQNLIVAFLILISITLFFWKNKIKVWKKNGYIDRKP